jgi:hypothetical protein
LFAAGRVAKWGGFVAGNVGRGGCSWVSICPVVDSVDTLWLAYRRAGQVACVVGVSLARYGTSRGVGRGWVLPCVAKPPK